MHGADWLPTFSDVAGYPLTGTMPLDGVSQWAEISGSSSTARGDPPPRTGLVIGNSTNLCSWPQGDPRRAKYEQNGIQPTTGRDNLLGCGFGIREGDWKLVQGYGGGPDGWCNTSAAGKTKANPDGWQCRNVTDMRHGCPNGWCLFDVVRDPLELNECSKENEEVTKRLQGRMERVLKTYTQYEADESCPPVAYAQDPKVGKTWEPWC